MPKPVIEVKELVKRYRKSETNAVDGVSFAVEKGAFFALLGPNGAGKTTTISILTTTLAATSGSIKIAGHDLEKDQAAVRRKVGIIFQKPSLDLNLTSEENVRLHAMLYGMYPFKATYKAMPEAYKQQVTQLAKIMDIEAEMFKPIKTLSGGQKRKLEIVRSLVHRPEILFLDEPTTGLDPVSRRSLWQYLEKVQREHRTTIFLTTHYLEEAEKADTVCVIDHGKIVALGAPAALKKQLGGSTLEETYLKILEREHESV